MIDRAKCSMIVGTSVNCSIIIHGACVKCSVIIHGASAIFKVLYIGVGTEVKHERY